MDLGEANRNALTRLVREFERTRGAAFALREATRHGLLDEIERLIESGVDINVRDECGRTALTFAYEPKIAELLIRHGADVNAQDKDGNTPLVWFLRALSAKRAAERHLRILVSAGADVRVRSSDGRSVQSMAEEKYGSEVANLLNPE